jgi:hypothetical protein
MKEELEKIKDRLDRFIDDDCGDEADDTNKESKLESLKLAQRILEKIPNDQEAIEIVNKYSHLEEEEPMSTALDIKIDLTVFLSSTIERCCTVSKML